jgi:hypothetical protein
MDWRLPEHPQLWHAIELYLSLAYPGPAPVGVRSRLEALRCVPPESLYRDKSFEAVPADSPTKLSLRLGNRFYPHMKLVIERAPDGGGGMFRADTHDRHIQPAAGSPEAAAFAQLMRENQGVARQIESAWDENGLPTFKGFLREDLARRRANPPATPGKQDE